MTSSAGSKCLRGAGCAVLVNFASCGRNYACGSCREGWGVGGGYVSDAAFPPAYEMEEDTKKAIRCAA